MELKVSINPIDGAGPARGLLSNLFYAAGYNFYQRASRLPVDDLLIRRKLAELLEESRVHLSALEAAFRVRMRGFAGPPTAATSLALEGAQRDLETMHAAVGNAALGEPEHFPPHWREGAAMLQRLVALDGEALLALVTLRDAIMKFDDGAAAAAGTPNLLRACGFNTLWSRREALLSADSA
ncbi:MAG TPA: hypothetical protein VGG63_08790 [Steroidobacteraceae bacterium]|jgi:hypothetical protein